MKWIRKLWGFSSDKKWKRVVASFYYFFSISFLIDSLFEVPVIRANMYDMVIFKTSSILFGISFLMPALLFSIKEFKNKIPFLKQNKWWTTTLGFIAIMLLFTLSSDAVNLFHSKDYQERYEDYNKTSIIYTAQESDEVAEEDKSSLSIEELNSNFDNLIDNDIKQDNNTSENNNDISVEEPNTNETPVIDSNIPNDTKSMSVHYIDVGQGDSIFIELPNSMTMLIDAGESSKGKNVINYIKSLGFSKINYLIGTHPHTDHIGGLAQVINTFDIEKIYMPKAVSTSKTYENLLNTISAKGLVINTAKAGVNIINTNDIIIDIIAPNNISYSNLNNYSVVLKIKYKNKSFLFTGDAETLSENEIKTNVSADVIKVAHHGSDSSSGQSFVNKVKPKYAIISVGTNNRYDHPIQSIIDRWQNSGAKVYRTDLNGTIIITTDGTNIDVKTTK